VTGSSPVVLDQLSVLVVPPDVDDVLSLELDLVAQRTGAWRCDGVPATLFTSLRHVQATKMQRRG
jgi:hypothetical protein